MLRLTGLVLAAVGVACVPTDAGPDREDPAPTASAERAGRRPEAGARARPRPSRARPDGAAARPRRTQGEARPVAPPPATLDPAAAGDSQAVLRKPFRDEFARSALGPDWNATSSAWRIRAGRLCGKGARNHPVWLTRKLPRNARIEFDATSASRHGDIKAELWGDGQSAARGTSYNDATSYLAILGGWRNRFHVLARRDEHAPDRQQLTVDASGAELRARPVEPNRSYHFKIERNDGKTIQWLVDDIELFSFTDPQPLAGPGHEHLGFNDWEVELCFDNLLITPLEGD